MDFCLGWKNFAEWSLHRKNGCDAKKKMWILQYVPTSKTATHLSY